VDMWINIDKKFQIPNPPKISTDHRKSKRKRRLWTWSRSRWRLLE